MNKTTLIILGSFIVNLMQIIKDPTSWFSWMIFGFFLGMGLSALIIEYFQRLSRR